MGQLLFFSIPVLLAIFLLKQSMNLRRNIQIAKTINLPYIVVPIYTGSIQWFLAAPIVLPVLRTILPSRFTRSWINFLHPFWTWYEEYKPFQEQGSDTIVTVSPGGIIFHTCCPEFIRQVGERRKDFHKPLELYGVLNIFGPNLASTNGDEWKLQRKVMLPSFNDAQNALVWRETVFQAKSMLQVWSSELKSGPSGRTIDFHENMRSLTLNVICRGSFGVRMDFPGSKDIERSGRGRNLKPGDGHEMTFGDATFAVVEGLKWLFVFPKWFLKYSVSKRLRRTWVGYHEMGKHMDELMSKKVFKGEEDKGLTLKDRSISSSLLNSLVETNKQLPLEPGIVLMSEKKIIANVWNSITAGHETTGSTLFHCLVNLALNPSWQRKVQADVDTIFGDQEPDQWCYKEGLEKLTRSSVDATVLETLRLYPPNNLIPKHSVERYGPGIDLSLRQSTVNVPADSRILILMVSSHHNPNYWPHSPSTNPSGTDLSIFKPERWFNTPSEASKVNGHSLPLHPIFFASPESRAGKEFFKPCRGAFIPWSIGSRDCIGRQFAHTELLVALAVILREWNVQLDAEGEGGEEWELKREEVMARLKDSMEHYATMQLRKGVVSVRILKREL